MNPRNNKSPNNKDTCNKNNKINPVVIDLSLNFTQKPDDLKSNTTPPNSPLHNGVEKSVEDLINELCNEFEEILNITTKKGYFIDQSLNNVTLDKSPSDLIKQYFPDNIKHNKDNQDNNNIMKNKSVFNKSSKIINKNGRTTHSDDNDRNSISYYLNTYNYNYHKQRNKKYCNSKTLTNTLMDINERYDDFNLKQFNFSNPTVTIPKPIAIEKKRLK